MYTLFLFFILPASCCNLKEEIPVFSCIAQKFKQSVYLSGLARLGRALNQTDWEKA